MPDKETTVKSLKEKVSAFIRERNWEQYHNPKDLSMSISIEAAELMELFQWKNAAEVEAVIDKLEKNAQKSNTPAWPEYGLQIGTLAIHYAKYPADL